MNSKTTASNVSSSWEFSKRATKYHLPFKKRAYRSPWLGGTSWHELKMEQERQAPTLSHCSKRPTRNKATFKVCVCVCVQVCVCAHVHVHVCASVSVYYCEIVLYILIIAHHPWILWNIGQVCGNVIPHKQAIEKMLVYSTSLELGNCTKMSWTYGVAFWGASALCEFLLISLSLSHTLSTFPLPVFLKELCH